jgi:hypothetical protein
LIPIGCLQIDQRMGHGSASVSLPMRKGFGKDKTSSIF